MEENVKDVIRKPALIYCRVSTAAQAEDGMSLETQEEACRAKAAELGYEVGRVTREVGSRLELWERPLLTRDRADLRAGRFGALISYCTDRLSGDPVHQFIIIEECSRDGVEVHFVKETMDDSDEGKLIQYVRGFVAKVEHAKIKERTMRGRLARVRSGKLHGGGCELYGYRRDHERGVREIHEPEALWVRRVYDWYVHDQMSIRSIANQLNIMGVPSPSVGKQRGKRKDREAVWCPAAIHGMLKNVAYKGETVLWRTQAGAQKGTRVPRAEQDQIRLADGTTPPIVSDSQWDAAQARMATNKGASTRNQKNPFLLRGLIFCSVCGRPMRCNVSKGRRNYRCSSLEDLSGPCGSKYVPADNVAQRVKGDHGRWAPRTKDTPTIQGIDMWAVGQVLDLLNNPHLADELLEREAAGEGVTSAIAADLESARSARAKLDRATERLLDLFDSAEEDMPLEKINTRLKAKQSEVNTLDHTIRELERRLSTQQRAVDEVNSLHEYLVSVGTRMNTDPNKDYGDEPRGILFDFPTMRRIVEDLGVRVTADGRSWRLDCDIRLYPPDADEDYPWKDQALPSVSAQAEEPYQSKRRTRPPGFPGGHGDRGSRV